MSSVVPFNFEQHAVRVVTRDGEPWFVAADVCAVLAVGNTSDAVRRLDDDEKGVDTIDTLGGRQEVGTINESGLYALILTSRKPEAKRFKKWVTGEVLPSIRRTGGYGLPAAPVIPQTLPDALRLAADLAEGKERAESALAIAAPKAEALDRLTDATGNLTPRDAAKAIQVKPGELLTYMRNHGWLYRAGERLRAYQPKIDSGMLVHKVTALPRDGAVDKLIDQVMVTPRGLAKLAVAFGVTE